MKILAIETSSSYLSLFVGNQKEILFNLHQPLQSSQSVDFFPAFQKALEFCEDSLDCFLLGLGPGNYGGIRVGIATAQAFSLARKVPLVGVHSFISLSQGDYCVIGNARRGDFFITEISQQEVLSTKILSPNEFYFKVKKMIKRDILLFTCENKNLLSLETLVCDRVNEIFPSAHKLFECWISLSSNQKEKLMKQAIHPIYLRDPHITL